MIKTYQNYFHCYATANDQRHYYRDIQNLLRIKNVSAGVPKLQLYIAISKVHSLSFFDRFFVWSIQQLFRKHPKVELKSIFFKPNVGRDFSSYAMMLDLIQQTALPHDYVFFQNRSGYGPFKNHWYLDFINQFEKYENTALCGSTINFRDHPLRSYRHDIPHIQTYAFMTKVLVLKLLEGSFPGIQGTSRLDMVFDGEINLSQFYLKRGYGISCMEWSDVFITNASEPVSYEDIRGRVTQTHQFYHKAYFEKENKFKKYIRYIYTVLKLLINCIFKKR